LGGQTSRSAVSVAAVLRGMRPLPLRSQHVGYFNLLRSRNFLSFFVGYGVSTLGTAAIPVAMSFALLGRGYSASMVGFALAAQTTPTVLMMLAGGVIGDRWPRRSIMMGADTMRCLSQGALALLLGLGDPGVGVILALIAFCGFNTALYAPAETGLVPQIAGDYRVRDANGLMSLAGSLAATLGPALGGLLVGVTGAPVAIGLDAASYAVSAICLSMIRLKPHVARPAASLGQDLRSGLQEFGRHKWLRMITLQQGLFGLFVFAPFFVLGPSLFARVENGAWTWGLVSAATGIGGFIGGFIVLSIELARPLLAVQAAAILMASPLVVLALNLPLALLAVGSALFGFALTGSNVLIQTALQERVPHQYLSRVSSIYSLVVLGTGPIGFAICGPVSKFVGETRLLTAGACVALVSAVLLCFAGSIRRFGAPDRRDARA
jgi:MFS family permease